MIETTFVVVHTDPPNQNLGSRTTNLEVFGPFIDKQTADQYAERVFEADRTRCFDWGGYPGAVLVLRMVMDPDVELINPSDAYLYGDDEDEEVSEEAGTQSL